VISHSKFDYKGPVPALQGGILLEICFLSVLAYTTHRDTFFFFFFFFLCVCVGGGGGLGREWEFK
jgi:hypothetical protein